MSAYFVTATGTDIGKTYVAAGLLRALRERRAKSWPRIKPVISGFDHGAGAGQRPGVLLDAMGEAVTPDAVARISPWRFAAPLVARHGGRARKPRDRFRRAGGVLPRRGRLPGTLLIEGVGGVMVPLDARHTVLDWMAALRACPRSWWRGPIWAPSATR